MKTFSIALASVFLLASAAHADDKSAAKDYVMLKVDGDDIKKSEVDEVWKSIFPGNNPPPFETFDEKVRNNVLRGIASEHVIEKEAEKAGVQHSEEVKEHIATATRQIVIREFLKEKTDAMITDDKLKAAYDEHVKATAGQDEVRARHILVKTEDEAKDIEKKLKKGVKFDKLAKEKSIDSASGKSGGELGYFTADKMVPEFAKAAFALKVGEVSAPVKTDFGWHIIEVEDRRKSTPPTFDQMKDALRQDIGNKVVTEYVDGLMKDTKITVVDADGHSKELPAPAPQATPAPAAGAADK